MTEKIVLYNKRTRRATLLPVGIGVAAISLLSGIAFGIYKGHIHNKRSQRETLVQNLIDQRSYWDAKEKIEKFYGEGIFDEEQRNRMLAAVTVGDEVFNLERRIAAYDYDGASAIFERIKDDPGIEARKSELSQALENINPRPIIESAVSYLIGNPRSAMAASTNNLNLYMGLLANCAALCTRDNYNEEYRGTLLSLIFNPKLPSGVNLLEIENRRVSLLSRFISANPGHEIHTNGYVSLVEATLADIEIRYNQMKGEQPSRFVRVADNYDNRYSDLTTILSGILDLNAMINIPEEVKKRIKEKIFATYDSLARSALDTQQVGDDQIIDNFFEAAERYGHKIEDESTFTRSSDLRKAKKAMETIKNSLILEGKYVEAYRLVLDARQKLLKDGISTEEGAILSEFERLGLELTNLMRN